jgi:hypothetical protein
MRFATMRFATMRFATILIFPSCSPLRHDL